MIIAVVALSTLRGLMIPPLSSPNLSTCSHITNYPGLTLFYEILWKCKYIFKNVCFIIANCFLFLVFWSYETYQRSFNRLEKKLYRFCDHYKHFSLTDWKVNLGRNKKNLVVVKKVHSCRPILLLNLWTFHNLKWLYKCTV